MAQVKRKKPNYLAIGIFFALGIIAILISVIFADKLVTRIRGGYPIYVTFSNVDGLVPGSKVVIGAGKNIGQVDDITLDGSLLKVKVFINDGIEINESANFRVLATSFVGGKYLAVDNYNGQAPYFQRDSVVRGMDPFTINTVLDQLGDLFSGTNDTEMLDGLDGLMENLQSILGDTSGIVKENRGDIRVAISNLSITSRSLNNLANNLDRKIAGISDAEFKQIIDDLQGSLRQLNLFLVDINSPNAPLSLLKDPSITHSIRTIVTNLEETTARIKARPSLLLRN